ncbi:conserved hypothetical protein [Candidatus Desulfosporosinus infrequens]|uniref:Uncharacterized protein n=1 Tax=Candidatus Desulfosporosinus infrequens TaxID=2043169 RepID=A0A2U3KD63_9FIRM|nr:conserved hypothetical protein [Candidatus Desulfosporosinus infrequens]
MSNLEHLDTETLPYRILGMQRLEALFNQEGYLICQSSGERIYHFDEVVAIFLPLSPSTDQVMAVHSDRAKAFMQSLLSKLH